MSESATTRLVDRARSRYPTVGCIYISPLSLCAAWYADPLDWEPCAESDSSSSESDDSDDSDDSKPLAIYEYVNKIIRPLTVILDSFNEYLRAETLEKKSKRRSPPRYLMAAFKDVDAHNHHSSIDSQYLRHLIYALLLDRMRWVHDYAICKSSPPPLQFQFTDDIDSDYIRCWDAAGDHWLKTVRDWEKDWEKGWKTAVVRDYDVSVLQALLDAVPPKKTTNVVSNVFLNFLQAAIALRLLMTVETKGEGKEKGGGLAMNFHLRTGLLKCDKHRMQSWDDNGLLRVLASAVAFSSIALLCEDLESGSPRGRGAASSTWKNLISGIKAPRNYVFGKPRDRASIEYSLWLVLLRTAIYGPHVFQISMDAAVDSWAKLGIYSAKYKPCVMPTSAEWDKPGLVAHADKASRSIAFALSRKMQDELRERSAASKPRPRKSASGPVEENEEDGEINMDTDSDMDEEMMNRSVRIRSTSRSIVSEHSDSDAEFVYPDWDPSTLPRNEEFGRELLAILHPPSQLSTTAPSLSSST